MAALTGIVLAGFLGGIDGSSLVSLELGALDGGAVAATRLPANESEEQVQVVATAGRRFAAAEAGARRLGIGGGGAHPRDSGIDDAVALGHAHGDPGTQHQAD